MNKNDYTEIKLNKGTVHVYDFGSIKLHAYETKDMINDEVFILEKGGKAAVIEAPCFKDNIAELTEYVAGMDVQGRLLAYHMAGNSFLPDVPVYTTRNAAEYGTSGGGAGLIANFVEVFGDSFEPSVPGSFEYIGEGRLELAGMEFIITLTNEAFDIEIPEINAVYTHMLGHDSHSIVAGADHADGIIAQLQGYMNKGYDLILTSHYTPEDLKDTQTKMDYIRDLKAIAAKAANAEDFKEQVQIRYPEYSGDNYLDMTAGMFFPSK